ncbi:MBL fold metallo-hydrolase [Infirmifilum sp. SLHALR2]|nr:MAG: hypothetical protein B7L53_04370 [Thermofilum sp. NZ13]
MHITLVDLDSEHPGLLASYVVETERSLLVFDPGPASTIVSLLKQLAGRGEKKVYVFVTHVHLDHAGGLGHLLEHVKVERVYVHERGVKHLLDPSRLWESSLSVLGERALIWGKPKPVDPEAVEGVRGGSRVELDSLTVEVVNCEGHASHQVCYYLQDGTIFPGDALGEVYDGNVLLLTPPPFLGSEALATIDRILRLNPERLALPHYGIYTREHRLCDRYKAKLLEALCLAALHQGDVSKLHEHLARDEEYRRGLEVLESRDRDLAKGFLERSITGLVEYVSRYGWYCPGKDFNAARKG